VVIYGQALSIQHPKGLGMSNGALDGIRVLDLTRILAGPSATQMLGDMGADVIKVERPHGGDDTRSWGPPYVKDEQGEDSTESGYYLCANRNKRSVAIDFTTDKGADTVKKLAAKADIFKSKPDLLFNYRFWSDRAKR
jgi:crotonobetainyl-CoA:carnitine CoA-transferase CaiB-like acyl-CoA transferase